MAFETDVSELAKVVKAAEQHWWAAARSEEVTNDKPFNVNIGDMPVVLWRDNDGMARAMEDRCPHRRAPLSLGCIRSEGWIQCGYHGWSFDGEDGRLKEIPNMKDKQKYPPVYRGNAFKVEESGGFIRICNSKNAVIPAPMGETMPMAGSVDVALDHVHFVNALFDDPSLIFHIKGVYFTPYLMSELIEENGRLTMERSCQWKTPHWPAPFSPEFPITLRITTDPVTGECDILLRDDDFNELLYATLAPVPAARGVTQVRWRAKIGANRPGIMAKLMGIGKSFAVLPHIDGAALRVLKPTASIHAEELRANIVAREQAEAISDGSEKVAA